MVQSFLLVDLRKNFKAAVSGEPGKYCHLQTWLGKM